jgi:hypothetical protein
LRKRSKCSRYSPALICEVLTSLAGEHLGVELGGGSGDAEVVLVGLVAELVVEAKVGDAASPKPLVREVHG